MDRSVNAPATCPDLITKSVYYMGADEIKEGEPFVYTTGAGTATDYSGLRHNQVARPTTSGQVFAGVATRNYAASPAGNGRLIEIALPGSKGVRIRVGAAIDQGDVCQFGYKATVGSKKFIEPANAIALTAVGIGDAIVRQTVTGAGLVQADLCEAPLKAGQADS